MRGPKMELCVCGATVVMTSGWNNKYKQKMILHSMCNKFKETCLSLCIEQVYWTCTPNLKPYVSISYERQKN